jgi:hypothetical protein
MIINMETAWLTLAGFAMSQLPTECEPTERMVFISDVLVYDMLGSGFVMQFEDGTKLEHIPESHGVFRLSVYDAKKGN